MLCSARLEKDEDDLTKTVMMLKDFKGKSHKLGEGGSLHRFDDKK